MTRWGGGRRASNKLFRSCKTTTCYLWRWLLVSVVYILQIAIIRIHWRPLHAAPRPPRALWTDAGRVSPQKNQQICQTPCKRVREMCICVHTFLCVPVYVFVCVCICLCVCVCVCVFVCVYMCVLVCVHVCVVSVSVCVCVCVCVSIHTVFTCSCLCHLEG